VLQTGNPQESQTLLAGKDYIENLAKVENLIVTDRVPADIGETIAGVTGTVQVLVPLTGVVDLEQLKLKLERSLAKLEGSIASLQSRLGNEGYVKKAPPEVVSTARAELEEAQQQLIILRSRLEQLNS